MSRTSVYRELLRNPDFRRLYAAHVVSLLGDWFAWIALAGLTLELTGSSLYASILLAGNFLPQFLWSPISGVLADRLNRKKLIVAADLLRAVFALGMLLVRSPGTVWIGIASLAGIASLQSFAGPASQAAAPNLIERKHLGAANVLMSSTWAGMLAIASMLGGLSAAVFGRDTTFLINSASFLVSAALVVRVKGRFSEERAIKPDTHPLRDLHEGISYARSHPMVMALFATKAGFGMGAGVIALLPVFAFSVFDKGDFGIGLLFAARGFGALLGPFGARAFAGESNRRLFLAIGPAMALYGIAYLGFAAMPTIWLAAIAVFVAHAGGMSQWVMSTYGLQKSVPDHVRGRIFSFDFALVTLTMSASFIVAGRLAQIFDPRAVVTGLAILEIVYAAVWTVATRRFWALRNQPLTESYGHGASPVGSPEFREDV